MLSWLWTKPNNSRTHRVGEDEVPGPTNLGDFREWTWTVSGDIRDVHLHIGPKVMAWGELPPPMPFPRRVLWFKCICLLELLFIHCSSGS